MRAMSADPPKQRLLRLLRRTTKGGRANIERSTADESALWSAHERALVRARDAGVRRPAHRLERGAAAGCRSTRWPIGRTPLVFAGRRASGRVRALARRLRAPGARRAQRGPRGRPSRRGRGSRARARQRRGARAVGARRRRRARAGHGLAQLAAELTQLESPRGQAQVVVAEVTQDSARAAGAASDAESALLDIGRPRQEGHRQRSGGRARDRRGERARAGARHCARARSTARCPRVMLLSALRPASSRSRGCSPKTSGRASGARVMATRPGALATARPGARAAPGVARGRAARRRGAQRAVHALKGSAGLAGERELAATLERLNRRIREGDELRLRRGGGARPHGRRAPPRGRVGRRGALARPARRSGRSPARSARARPVCRGGHRSAGPHRRARWRPATTRSRPRGRSTATSTR